MAASTKAGLKDNPAMSFVMLTDSQVVPAQPNLNGQPTSQSPKVKGQSSTAPESSPNPDKFSHRVETATRLFEIVSARSDIDHPICTECTDLLLAALSSRLSSAIKERDAYISFLKTLKNNAPSPADLSKAQATLKSAQEAEAKAFRELVSLEDEKNTLDTEVAELEAESQALDAEEQQFWRSRNAFALKLSEFQNQRDALNAAYDHDTQQLERLQRTNVYNDTFCIGHDGFFGTINGLRLGRLPPPQNVDWSEINAAWGNAALLLATVADKLGFTFRGYRIKPMGSTSRIEKIEYPPSSTTSASPRPTPTPAARDPQPKTIPLDLFSSGDLPMGRIILHRRIDAGMVAFLECLRQLGGFVHSPNPTSSPTNPRPSIRSPGKAHDGGGDDSSGGSALPYKIHKDKIDDVSIKLGNSTDEAWTRACKYALTCCKFLLAHASNTGGGARRGAG
jgi:beclin 1